MTKRQMSETVVDVTMFHISKALEFGRRYADQEPRIMPALNALCAVRADLEKLLATIMEEN